MLSPKLPRLFARVLGLLVLSATVALAAPTPFLRYDFHAGAKDSSGNFRDGALTGTATVATPPGEHTPALDNSAANMSGAGGGIRFKSPRGLPAFKSFTVTQWFRTPADTALATSARLFEFSGVSGTTEALLLAASSDNGNLTFNRGGVSLLSNGSPRDPLKSLGSWVFVALVHDGTTAGNNLRLYMGSDTDPVTLIGQSTATAPVWAGTNADVSLVFGSNIDNGRSLKGWLDDIRIYGDMLGSSGALTTAQLDSVRLERPAPLPPAPLVHYDFNTPSAPGTAPDLTGNGRTGTLAGGAGWGHAGPSGKPIDVAFDNSAATMSGAGGSLGFSGPLGSLSSFTLSLWYRADGQFPKGAARLLQNSDQLLAFDGLDSADSGKIIFKSGTTEILRDTVERPLFKTKNVWTFLALTYDGATARLYGGDLGTPPVEIYAQPSTAGAIAWTSALTRFGANLENGRAFKGMIDNIRIYGASTGTAGALSLTKIEDIYLADRQVAEVATVAPAIWAGHPVDFALLTHGGRQYAAYYDDQQQMTVASRAFGAGTWTRQKLPSFTPTDTHNYITLAVDSSGQLHVAGNMHDVPLAGYNYTPSQPTRMSWFYFRTSTPGDISTLLKKAPMVNADHEGNMTYPKFIKTSSGELFFTYRDGESGSGTTFLNKYNPNSSPPSWSRVSKLFDGTSAVFTPDQSAYPIGPLLGPDGKWHMTWVWRETSSANSNHSLSYAWSNDLVTWQTSTCQPITLPITPATPGVVIDPIPMGGGILNGSGHIGFDQDNKVVVSYHKYDGADYSGPTKIYLKRRNSNGTWQSACVTPAWTYRWELGGAGSIGVDVAHTALGYKSGLGHYLSMKTKASGSSPGEEGTWLIDPVTLARIGAPIPANTVPGFIPSDHFTVQRPEPGMGVRRMTDSGTSPAGLRHVLRWETLPVNRDLPPETIPAPGELKIVTLPAE